jgi:hypothetical protein
MVRDPLSSLRLILLEDHWYIVRLDLLKNLFPTYLCCPFIKGRKKKNFFQPMIDKVQCRIQAWKFKHLSHTRQLQLISSILLALSLHIMHVLSPPKAVLRDIECLRARFFLGIIRIWFQETLEKMKFFDIH